MKIYIDEGVNIQILSHKDIDGDIPSKYFKIRVNNYYEFEGLLATDNWNTAFDNSTQKYMHAEVLKEYIISNNINISNRDWN